MIGIGIGLKLVTSGDNTFKFTVDAGGGLHQFTLPLVNGFNYNFEVDWGDGTTSTITAWNDADITHTYASDTTYQISINGTLESFSFNNTGDMTKMISVDQWGDVGMVTLNGFCAGCSNLISVAAADGAPGNFTTPMASGILSAQYAFSGCTSLVTFPTLYINSCQDFTGFFQGCAALTDAGYIEVGGAGGDVVYNSMYSGCTSLVSLNSEMQHFGGHGTEFQYMFSGCTAFEGMPEQNFTTGVNFTAMFNGCTALTSVDLTFTSNATTFTNMFSGCTALTEFVAKGVLTGGVYFNSMFSGCSALTSVSGMGVAFSALQDVGSIVSGCGALETFEFSPFCANVDFSNTAITPASAMNNILSACSGSFPSTITITGTPEATQTGCTPSLATTNGWTVVQNDAYANTPTITDLVGGTVRFNENASLGSYSTARNALEYQVNSGGWTATYDNATISVSSGDYIELMANELNSAGTAGPYASTNYTYP